MTIKSSQDLVNNALKEIKTITSNEAAKLFKENKCNLIDIRDIRELERDGRVKNSLHIPRGMLELVLNITDRFLIFFVNFTSPKGRIIDLSLLDNFSLRFFSRVGE